MIKKYIYLNYDNTISELSDRQMVSTYDGGWLELTQEEYENYQRVIREFWEIQDWMAERAKPNK